MQVAVAGMEHIGDPQAMKFGQVGDSLEHGRQFPARNGSVHAQIVGRNAADGRKCRLAAGPEQMPLRFAPRAAHSHRAVGAGDCLTRPTSASTSTTGPSSFHDQQGFDIQRIARVNEFLDRVDGGPVHHFHAGRNDAGRDDFGHALTGPLAGAKAEEQGARRLRLPENADRHLRDDPEQPLRSGHQPEQVIAFAVEMLPAEANDLARSPAPSRCRGCCWW